MRSSVKQYRGNITKFAADNGIQFVSIKIHLYKSHHVAFRTGAPRATRVKVSQPEANSHKLVHERSIESIPQNVLLYLQSRLLKIRVQ